MNNDRKKLAVYIGLILLYICVGFFGVYNSIGTVLFPICTLPFALYVIRRPIQLREHAIFHIIVGLSALLIGGDVNCILIYILGVCLPTYVIKFFYDRKFTLPNIIMNVGLCLSLLAFVFLMYIKARGIDFEAIFAASIDEMKENVHLYVDYMAQRSSAGAEMTSAQHQQLRNELFTMMTQVLESMKSFYAAIIVLIVFGCSSFVIIVLNSILRVKDKSLPGLVELFEFRVSRMAVLVLVLAMFLMDMESVSTMAWAVVGVNVMLFLMTLFQISGALALLGLIKKKMISGGFRWLSYIGVVLLFIVYPAGIAFFGCVDSIFNFRKVKITV